MKRRIIAVLMSAAFMITTAQVAFASDITGHWAEKYIKYLDEQGVINPSAQTGNYSPDAVISRAEFMRYINRAFHFTETAEIKYSDVDEDAWYYETVKIAEKYGYINGIGDNKMNPEGDITREQAATIIGRLYKTTEEGSVKPSQLTFTDKDQISTWSAAYIHDAVQKGYITGYPDGTFNPKKPIKRSEISRILYSYIGTSLSEEGVDYTGADLKSDVENVTISEGCTLSNAEVGGDLYITEGVGSEEVTLRNVTMTGTLIISGGNVTLENVDAPTVIVGSSINRLVKVSATGSTSISVTKVQSTSSLIESGLDVSAGGFSDVSVYGDDKTTTAIDGKLWKLDLLAPSAVTLSNSSEINTLNVYQAGTVSGYGKISQANIYKSGSNITMKPDSYQLAENVTATINGKLVSKQEEATIKPSSFTWDKSDTNRDEYYDFRLSVPSDTISSVTMEGRELVLDDDYKKTSKGISFSREFFRDIKTEGDYIIYIKFDNDEVIKLKISVIDSSRNTVTPTGAVFDKNKDSNENRNLSFTLSMTDNAKLDRVSFSGKTLTEGDDYSYSPSSGEVEIRDRYLKGRENGTYTVTFYMTRNNSVTASVLIKDSTPANTLSTEKIDFDVNKYSGEYTDPKVTLKPVDGARLVRINAKGTNKVLDEGWQYVISDDGEVTLKGSALESLASDGRNYIDLEFEMSRGANPVLRVNFITTYSVRVSVKDDNGIPVSGARITLSPEDTNDEMLTKEQSKTTDNSGTVTFYARKGIYKVDIKGDNFENKSQSVNVSYSQSVDVEVAIQEVVKLAITEPSGAYISGAVVTLDDQKVTTGEDGIATFKIERGRYDLTVIANGYRPYITSSFDVKSSVTQRITLSK